MAIRAHWIALLFMASAASVGCESDADPSDPSAPLLLAVELPPMSQKALIMASAELCLCCRHYLWRIGKRPAQRDGESGDLERPRAH